MASLTLQLLVLGCLFGWLAWKLSSHFVLRSPLDVLQGPPPSSFIFGNISQIFAVDGREHNHRLFERYGQAFKFTGVLGERLLLTFDSKALHHILFKDQHIYQKATPELSVAQAFLGQGLLSTLGDQHKKQRKLMNPAFSVSHIREMTPLFYEVVERLRISLKKRTIDGPKEIDIMQWMTRTALELIGRSGMDYSFDTLESDELVHPYAKASKRLTELLSEPFGLFCRQFVFPFAGKFDFPRMKRLIVDLIPLRKVREIKSAADVMHQTSLDIIKAKRDALNSSDPQIRAEMMEKKDIASILMKANEKAKEGDQLTDEEVIGQVSTFVFAGQDSVSSIMCRILHLLCMHQDSQEKLRNEIRTAQMDGQLSFDQLASLPQLDAVYRETIRLYPPLSFGIFTTACKDTILPLSKPISDIHGREVSEITVPSGTQIVLSILGSNTNPDLWGNDALEWKPERWSSPLPGSVTEAQIPGVYSHTMTFLGGSRACIGFKLSEIQIKAVLSVLLSTFKFNLLKGREIQWKTLPVASSYVGSDMQLPLVMTPLD